MPQRIQCKIAGIFSYPKAKDGLKQMLEGDFLTFQKEPNNQHDKNAIALFVKTPDGPEKVGYIPKVIAESLKNEKIKEVIKGAVWDMVLIVTE